MDSRGNQICGIQMYCCIFYILYFNVNEAAKTSCLITFMSGPVRVNIAAQVEQAGPATRL